MTDDILAAIKTASAAYDLPDTLLLAIVLTESFGKPHGTRVEPHYRYLWDCAKNRPFRSLERFEIERTGHPAGFSGLNGSSADTEWWHQRTSWGPMQIMGATARELGFTGFLPELCGPLGIEYGALYLAALHERFFDKHGWESVIAAYNAGSPRRDAGGILENAGYVAKVRKNGFSG